MGKNSDEFSMNEAMRLAKSDAGRKLFSMLREQNGDALNQAMADASAGDFEKVKKELAAMLASPQVQAMLAQLRGQRDG